MDEQAKKVALRKLTYGLYVVTAIADGEVAAGTVSWLSQASFNPPLIMAGIKADSHLHARIAQSGAFAVSVIGEEQKEMARAFFRASEIVGDRIGGYAFDPGPETGAPVLLDAPVWFEARIRHTYAEGDHTVCIAEVVSAGVHDADASPLVLGNTGWSYGG
ncbi:MAG: flavin reductase family protein [Anaerolineae bacterium]|nr:flavin reductase family protein [Anaerolineae bacterium]